MTKIRIGKHFSQNVNKNGMLTQQDLVICLDTYSILFYERIFKNHHKLKEAIAKKTKESISKANSELNLERIFNKIDLTLNLLRAEFLEPDSRCFSDEEFTLLLSINRILEKLNENIMKESIRLWENQFCHYFVTQTTAKEIFEWQRAGGVGPEYLKIYNSSRNSIVQTELMTHREKLELFGVGLKQSSSHLKQVIFALTLEINLLNKDSYLYRAEKVQPQIQISEVLQKWNVEFYKLHTKLKIILKANKQK